DSAPENVAGTKVSSGNRKEATRLYKAGVQAGLKGNYGDAADKFIQSLALNPANADAHFSLAHAYVDMGRWGEGMEALRTALRLDPKDAAAYELLGFAQSKLGDYKQAVESFRQAVLLKPDFIEARYNLGNAFYKLGQYSAAVAYYNEVAGLRGNEAAPFNDLGASYAQMNRDHEAFQAFKRAIQNKSNNAPAHNNIALIHYRQGHFVEAVDAFKRALEFDPANPVIRRNLDMALARQNGVAETAAQSATAPGVRPGMNSGDKRIIESNQWLVRTFLDQETTKPVTPSISPQPAPLTQTVASTSNRLPLPDASVKKNSSPPPAVTPTVQQPQTSETAKTKNQMAANRPAASSPDTTAGNNGANNPNAPTSVYRIGAGDMLDVRLLNRPANGSTLFTVLAGGLLEYPLLGAPLMVSGMTTDEIDERLTAEIERRGVVRDPEVIVSVREYASHVVIVSGLVNDPGNKVLRREAIPLYVVLADAQPKPEAGRVEITSHQTGQRTVIDLTDQSANNMLVYPGDVLNVVTRPQLFYFIGGNVGEPGQKDFHPGLTLTQSVLAAGGSLQEGQTSAKATNGVTAPTGKTEIRVTRQSADGRLNTLKFNLREIMTGKIPDPILQAGDRVEVGK
ncbi:MAG TPA: tetratricopeptide repeat protein, partial [Pyrinomonadaceae bacterium]|nr:tetratricopeptide repeat protein [Pyrinomonadaceae bacterium]